MKRSSVLCLSAALALGLSACGGTGRDGGGLMTGSGGGAYRDENGVYHSGVYDGYTGGGEISGGADAVTPGGSGHSGGADNGDMGGSGNVRDPDNRAYDGTYGSGGTGRDTEEGALRKGMDGARNALEEAGDAARDGLNDARDAIRRAGDDPRDQNARSGMAD